MTLVQGFFLASQRYYYTHRSLSQMAAKWVAISIELMFLYSLLVLYFIQFLSKFYFSPFFFPLPLGSSYFSFSSSLRCNVRLFTRDFLVSWDRSVMILTHLLLPLLQQPRIFDMLCCHSHLSLYIFWSHLLFILWPSHFFSSMLFNLHIFVGFFFAIDF